MTNRMNQFIQSETTESVESFELKKINIKYIKENEKNIMPMGNIDDLKESIKTHGLQDKIVVRPIKESENLKERYMILSGHRRYRALKEINEETGDYKSFEVLINNDINTELDERVAIAVGNAHREENDDVKYIKTKEWGIIYEELKANGEINEDDRFHKENWIGERMNISGRTIRRYRDYMNLKNKGTEEKTEEEILQKEEADLIFVAREILRNPYLAIQGSFDGKGECDFPHQYERARI